MDVESYSPLSWAYLGDAIWELYVRQSLMKESLKKAGDYHNAVVPLVSAKIQARIIMDLLDSLPQNEFAIFKRGRNSCTSYRRSSTQQEYAYSTGFEAILGYLFLTGEKDRLREIMIKFLSKGKEVLKNENPS